MFSGLPSGRPSVYVNTYFRVPGISVLVEGFQ